MGRTSASANLKILKGRSAGRDSGGRPVAHPPKFIREAPEPPDWLDAEGRTEWERITPVSGRGRHAREPGKRERA
jgi:phage terminase small subunit